MLDLAAQAGPGRPRPLPRPAAAPRSPTLPAPGLTLPDLIAVNKALLASGATIHEMNCIPPPPLRLLRRPARGRGPPARIVTLAISDVPGDDPTVIASGPTVPDPSTFEQARALVAHYGMTLPAAVIAHLAAAH
jgi:glycerate 2-kinase